MLGQSVELTAVKAALQPVTSSLRTAVAQARPCSCDADALNP